MKCERLRDLTKNWYFKVQDETMAPARMVSLMGKHISLCEECLADPDVKIEVRKIKEFFMPPPVIKVNPPVPETGEKSSEVEGKDTVHAPIAAEPEVEAVIVEDEESDDEESGDEESDDEDADEDTDADDDDI